MRQGSSAKAGSVRFAVVVTLVVLLVWGIVGGIVWYVVRAGLGWFGEEGYARIEAVPGKVVWLETRGSQVRTSPTKEGLETAAWQGPEADSEPGAPMVELPLQGEASAGWEAIAVGLQTMPGSSDARWRLRRKGEDGATWEYTVEAPARLGDSADDAPLLTIPRLTPISLEVKGEPRLDGRAASVGVALTVNGGDCTLTEVRKDEDPEQAAVRVLDDNGAVVAEQTGSLGDFGFT